MSSQKWEYKGSGQEIEIIVPDKKSRDFLDDVKSRVEDDFMSNILGASNEIRLKVQQNHFNSIPDLIFITLSPEKARELAHFLLTATEDLD